MEKDRSKRNFKDKVDLFNFVLCVIVIWIHSQNMELFIQPIIIGGVPVFNMVENFLANEIGMSAVGGFFLVSGYLFYRNFSYADMGRKLKSRCLSLVLPFVVWNLIYYLVHYAVSILPGIRDMVAAREIPLTIKELWNAVINYAYNPVFWYLQFLIIFVFCCPLFYLLIRNRWAGGAVLILILLLNSGFIIQLNDTFGALSNWAFIYLTGGYLGIHAKDFVERIVITWKLLAVMLILTVILGSMRHTCHNVVWTLLYYLLASLSIWGVIVNLPHINVKEFMKNTFFVYAVHFALVKGANKVVHALLGDSMWVGIALFLFLPLGVFAFSRMIQLLCGRFFLPLWNVLSGKR